jgi:hypothetical protein
VDLERLTAADESLYWDDVENISVDRFFVSVNKKGHVQPWLDTSSWEISNSHVLRALMERILGIVEAHKADLLCGPE